jgi:hypothetical protein
MTRSDRITRSAALALLGLPDDASPRDITQAYRRLAKQTHPDRMSTPPTPTTADGVVTDSQQRFAQLADAYHALASTSPSTTEPSPPDTSPPGRTPSPGPSTAPGAVSIPVRVRRPAEAPPERPPIIAGPVHITPSPPPAATPRRST